VEGGTTAADRNRPTSFIARDIVVLPADVRIEGTAPWVLQRADGLDVRVDWCRVQSNNGINWF